MNTWTNFVQTAFINFAWLLMWCDIWCDYVLTKSIAIAYLMFLLLIYVHDYCYFLNIYVKNIRNTHAYTIYIHPLNITVCGNSIDWKILGFLHTSYHLNETMN